MLMDIKQKCPHCGKMAYQISSLHNRIEKEGFFNACEYCRFEDSNIRNKVDLKKLYIKLNEIYFNNKLPDVSEVKLEWNASMTSTAGLCVPSKKLIKISYKYHNLHPKEINNTMAHEMIHLKYDNHRIGFKKEAERITKMGLEITIYTKYDESRKIRQRNLLI
jgi:predicted metal-dependent hydrolase